MMIYAVIKTGGKQYKVAPGDVVRVEKLPVAVGSTVEIREVYLLANGQDITTGNPTIANARVVAEVLGDGRDEKIIVFKKKRRKGYRKTIGHRQYFTSLRNSEIALGSDVHKAQAAIPKVIPKKTKSTAVEPPLPSDPVAKAPIVKSAPTEKTPAPVAATPKQPEPEEQLDKITEILPEPDSSAAAAPTQVPPTEPKVETPEPVITAHESTPVAARAEDPPVSVPVDEPKIESPAPVESDVESTPVVDTPKPAQFFEPPPERETSQKSEPSVVEPKSRSNMPYWILAALLLLLLSGIVVYFLGDTGRRTSEESVPLAVEPQEPQETSATPAEPKPSKPTKRAAPDIKIKKPVAGAAPSAPVQPPD